MRKLAQLLLTLTIIVMTFSVPQAAQAEAPVSAPSFSTASELISAVNALRALKGLAPYQTNSILMSIAQTHADYLISIGTGTHVDAQGRLPYQRALAAGYPVAGNITTNVGFFSENITGGVGLDADGAVENWRGDEPHRLTMLSPMLQDVGVGVGINGNTFYYVLDAGLSTGGTPVAYTPPAPLHPAGTPAIVPNTPNADGSIVHIVQPGDTTLGIAIAYGISLTELLNLNKLTEKSVIYPEQTVIVRAGYTPTPTSLTSTPTIRPTITPWPTSLPTATETEIPPTPTPSPGLPESAAIKSVIAIAVAAILAAGVVTLLGRKRKS
ncbi:MAG: CAP domain-containing protein [Chloroflexota bacterium]